MIVETALLLGGAVVTAMVGAPLVGRLGDAAHWRQHAPPDAASRRTALESRKAFEPLDLGPDLMRWPSEVERREHGSAEPQWPSQTWDDPHFGAKARALRADVTAADQLARAQATRPRPAPPVERVITAEPQPAVDAGPVTIGVSGTRPDVPAVEELERLVATVGLAGTVQEIMARTGWDFRQAAHHLARARQQGR